MKKGIMAIILTFVCIFTFSVISYGAQAEDYPELPSISSYDEIDNIAPLSAATMIWHSDGTWVGVWKGSVNVHTYTLGTVSNGFIFHQRMLEAQKAWASALGITITGVTQAVDAQIRSWGGQRAEIEAFRGEYGTTWTGLAEYPTLTEHATHVINGTTRTVNRLTGQGRMFVIQRSTAATWTQDDIDRTKKTATHELGHSLGYRGHSPNITANNQDVMWATSHASYTLTQNEKTHLKQMYDLYK